VFDAASAAFLREQVTSRPQLALDLGCAAGRSTRLIANVTSAELVVGLDTSESFLRWGRSVTDSRVAYIRADATQPFPTRSPDLVYSRLVLAHLPTPEKVVAGWAQQLRPGGLLLLDEVERIETPNPVLALYEEIVTAMVAARGAQVSVGPRIGGLSGEGWRERANEVRGYPVATADAARMYSMNLATWRHDPFVAETYDSTTIDDLASGLDDLTRSAATGEINWALRQVVYERL